MAVIASLTRRGGCWATGGAASTTRFERDTSEASSFSALI
jgi:hypothetical protein